MTVLLLIGLWQTSMVAVFLLHKGFHPRDIWQATQPMMVIWVFFWPVYQSLAWLWMGLLLWLLLLLAARLIEKPFWLALRKAWSPHLGAATAGQPTLLAPFSLWLALLIAATLFEQGMPEFGFGIALSACLSFPLARLCDRMGYLPLAVSLHPEHTLPGQLLLLLSMTILCTWSIHVYHDVDWLLILPAATMAACVASVIRMLLPQWWNLPLAMLASSFLLWYL